MSYKRGIPYVWADENDDGKITVHFWGEHDESYKQVGWYENRKDKGVDLDGIKMSMKDFDEIVIKRVEEIIRGEYNTDKYKKIERTINEIFKKDEEIKKLFEKIFISQGDLIDTMQNFVKKEE